MQLANLDIDVLRTLAVAMDLGGFSKAAERLGRSQSAVSLQMRRLEERVGRPLFRREGRGLALTDAGDVVLGYARQILELNDQAVAAARGIAIGGSVRFGVPQDFGDSWLPSVLARFSRAHPSVLIEARVDRANKLVERIAEGGLDLALMWGNPSVANTVTVQRLPMVWIGPRGYAVPRGETVPLALFESPCVFRQPAVEALEQAQRPWRLAFTSPSSERIMGGCHCRPWGHRAHHARFAVAACSIGQVQRFAEITADRAVALHGTTGAAAGRGALTRNPDRGAAAAGLGPLYPHVWTYMDPARLQQADWIRCNRHNC